MSKQIIRNALYLCALASIPTGAQAEPYLQISGDLDSYYAERVDPVAGREGMLWFTATGNPDVWIYVPKNSLASAALTTVKTMGPDYFHDNVGAPPGLARTNIRADLIDPAGDRLQRQYNRFRTLELHNGNVSSVDHLSFMTVNRASFTPNAWVTVRDSPSSTRVFFLATADQAAAASYAIALDKPVAYGTDCGLVVNTASGQLEQLCNMASWLQVDP